MLIALGILALMVIWALIVTSCTATIWRFIKAYQKASAEIDKEEVGDEGPQYRF